MDGKRDPRYSRTVGDPPFSGRRYVRDGKVRIEWREGGVRRSQTVGPNTAANRQQADQILEEILSTMTDEQEVHTNDAASDDESTESHGFHFVLPEPVRQGAVFLMDKADDVADWIEEGIGRLWSTPGQGDDVEEAEVTEVTDVDEQNEDDAED